MLDPFCSTCGSRVLITAARVLAVHKTSTGNHVVFRCLCENIGVWKAPTLQDQAAADGETAATQAAEVPTPVEV